MTVDDLKWSKTCCAWHGEYTEAKTMDGCMARIKRSQYSPLYLVCRFGPDNKAIDADGDGVPDYVEMTQEQVNEMLGAV